MLRKSLYTSFIEHLLVLLEIGFQFLIPTVLCINRSDVSDVSDFSVVVMLKLVLIRLNLFSQFPPLSLYIRDQTLYLFLGHFLSPSTSQRLLQLLIVNIKRTQRLLLVVVWLTFEICVKIAIITFQLVFYFFLLIGKTVDTHGLNVLFQLYFSVGFEK